jgi:hypothetical protein
VTDPRLMTVRGTYETRDKQFIGDDPTRPNPVFGQRYETIGVSEVMALARTTVPKDQAQWILCSTYCDPDGRHHKIQEVNGTFAMLALDIDQGNIKGKQLLEAVQGFTGKVWMRIYTSSSATAEQRKWRVLIPLAEPTTFERWHALSVALHNHIKAATGITPDPALLRAGQPIYLPNTAPRTDGVQPLIEDKVIEAPAWDWRESETAVAAADEVIRLERERQQEVERRAAEARRRMAQVRARPSSEKSVIEQFNDNHDLEQTLIACGYRQGPRGSWRSPLQESGSYATKTFDEPAGQYWVSLSGSDLGAGLGNASLDGKCCFGDAFDVWVHFQHGGNRVAAIKAAAAQLGIKPPPTISDQLASMVRAQQARASAAPAVSEPDPDFDAPAPAQPQATESTAAPQAQEQSGAPAPDPDFDAPPGQAPKPLSDEFATVVATEQDEATRTLPFRRASELAEWTPPRELVESMLIEGAMSVIYGDSNTGKSFLALYLSWCICTGRKFFGKHVQQGAVLYVAAESPRSIMDRARAIGKVHQTAIDSLFITECTVDLFGVNGDSMALVNTIKEVERISGQRVVLVVLDTLARAMGAGDENASKDMGALVMHGDLIRTVTGAHLLIVHHTGKDASKGARGSSALRAATDTEIEVKDPGKGMPREFALTKQRDLGGKGERFGFNLRVVELGVGMFGSTVTTCVVAETEPGPESDTSGLTDEQLDILELIEMSPHGGLKTGDIADAMQGKCSRATTKRHLGRLMERRMIYRQSGQYRLGSGQPMQAPQEF